MSELRAGMDVLFFGPTEFPPEDSARAATAIMAALGSPDLPRRLALGTAAVAAIREQEQAGFDEL